MFYRKLLDVSFWVVVFKSCVGDSFEFLNVFFKMVVIDVFVIMGL